MVGALKVYNSATGQWEYAGGAAAAEYAITAKNMSDLPATYPVGITHFNAGASPDGGGDWPAGVATNVITYKASTARTVQHNIGKDGERHFIRAIDVDNASWSPWRSEKVIVCSSSTRPSGSGIGIDGLEIYELDTGFKRIWNGSDWEVIGGLERYRARLWKNTTLQSVTNNTTTNVSFAFGSGWSSMYSVANNRFIVPITGTYHVSAHVSWNTAFANECRAVIYNNGTDHLVEDKSPGSGSGAGWGGALSNPSADVELTAGDLVTLLVWQNSGGAVDIGYQRAGTYMTMRLVGVPAV